MNIPDKDRETPSASELHIRRILCARVGHRPYMDDGEASDSSVWPYIDFLRDAPAVIEAKLRERALLKMGEALGGGAYRQEKPCNPHPKAPHGFSRNASHDNGHYVCECSGWDPYDAGHSDGYHEGLAAGGAAEVPPTDQQPAGYVNGDELDNMLEDRWATAVGVRNGWFNTPIYTKPPEWSDPVKDLAKLHAWLLQDNEYAYCEIAYTRRTGWMAWLTDKPLAYVVESPDRQILAQGQGDTMANACASAVKDFGGRPQTLSAPASSLTKEQTSG